MKLFKKIIFWTGIVLIVLAVLGILVVNLTPVPISMLVRDQFKKKISTEPNNYGEYANKVSVIHDIEYVSEFKDNKADLYLPKNGRDFPLIIWVHGGAFVGGDKKDVENYATMLAANGYAVLAMNYERSPELKYPNQLKQIEEVYKSFKDVALSYGVDINKLYLAGDSAGALMVSQIALIQSSTDYAKMMNFESIIPIDTIKGLLLYCGPYDLKDINKTSSPFVSFIFSQVSWSYFGIRNWTTTYGDIVTIKNHVTEDFPATFITDGNDFSFEKQAKELEKALINKNVSVKAFYIPENIKASHEYQFKLDTEYGFKSLDETLEFLRETDE